MRYEKHKKVEKGHNCGRLFAYPWVRHATFSISLFTCSPPAPDDAREKRSVLRVLLPFLFTYACVVICKENRKISALWLVRPPQPGPVRGIQKLLPFLGALSLQPQRETDYGFLTRWFLRLPLPLRHGPNTCMQDAVQEPYLQTSNGGGSASKADAVLGFPPASVSPPLSRLKRDVPSYTEATEWLVAQPTPRPAPPQRPVPALLSLLITLLAPSNN